MKASRGIRSFTRTSLFFVLVARFPCWPSLRLVLLDLSPPSLGWFGSSAPSSKELVGGSAIFVRVKAFFALLRKFFRREHVAQVKMQEEESVYESVGGGMMTGEESVEVTGSLILSSSQSGDGVAAMRASSPRRRREAEGKLE